MSKTGQRIKALEKRVEELENKVKRLMNDLKVRNTHADFLDSEGLSQT